MKSFKNRALLVAGLGFAGLWMAGSAFAACPSTPTPPWSAAPVFQGTIAIASPGYATTGCRLDSAISASASGAAFATVEDDSPTAEPRYRVQFILDADNLTNQSLLEGVQIFSAVSSASGTALRLTMFGDGSGGRFLGYFVTDSNQAGGTYSSSVPLAAGENHVEFDLQVGSPGSITLWVNNNVEGSPTVSPTAVNDSAVIGIDTAYMGLAAPSPQYVAAFAGTTVGFDEFDSRRSTFIGY